MKKNKSLIPYIIFSVILFYAVLDLIFIFVADYTFTGVFTDNYYQKGVDFNKINQQGMYHDKIGWKSSIVCHHGKIIFYLKDQVGKPITGAIAQAKIRLPVSKKYDALLDLEEEKPGVYTANFQFPFPAQWDIRVKANYEGIEYIATKRESFNIK